MAELLGNMMFKGRIGEMIFYQKNGKHFVMAKAEGASKAKMKRNSNYDRTLENAYVFGMASRHGKAVRVALGMLFKGSMNSLCCNKLQKVFYQNMVSNPDVELRRGHGKVWLSDLSVRLLGYNFNVRSNYETICQVPISLIMDRAIGRFGVKVHAHNSRLQIHAPSGTTHYQFSVGVVLANGVLKEYKGDVFQGAKLLWDNSNIQNTDYVIDMGANVDSPFVMVVVGLLFFQEVSDVMYPLKNGWFSPYKCIGIDVI